VFAQTSLYRSPVSISAALGQLRRAGLTERREVAATRHEPRFCEWRRLPPLDV
jgi:hypothetical protein